MAKRCWILNWSAIEVRLCSIARYLQLRMVLLLTSESVSESWNRICSVSLLVEIGFLIHF